MTDIINRLRLDHKRFGELLKQLAETAEAASSGDAVAEDRLFCMVEYLRDYPHTIHHPTEDIVWGERPKLGISELMVSVVDLIVHK